LNDGRIQNLSNPFGTVPLSNFEPRGFGFVHHSIAIFYHEVPNPHLTIRNFFIAVRGGRERTRWLGEGPSASADTRLPSGEPKMGTYCNPLPLPARWCPPCDTFRGDPSWCERRFSAPSVLLRAGTPHERVSGEQRWTTCES
jgi:hypothetical protein